MYIYRVGKEAKRKSQMAISGQRVDAPSVGVLKRTTGFSLGLLTTSPLSLFSLFLLIPAPDPCLLPAFLPHSEIPREQAMISNGGALRRWPCSFPFFSVRSSCSSSCREENLRCTPPFLLTFSYLFSEGILRRDPRALSSLLPSPSSSSSFALPREA